MTVILLALISASLIGIEFAMRKNPKSSNHHYLLLMKFWFLERHSNIIGQWNNKEILPFQHSPLESEDIIMKKPEGATRIILLGSSTTHGGEVNKNERFSSLLQEKLNNYYSEKVFDVVNAGVGGYSSYQLLVLLEEVLQPFLSPDIVIFYFGNNDKVLDGWITDREYYQRARRMASKIQRENKDINLLFKYGINCLNPLNRLLNESRLWGYLFKKYYYCNLKQLPKKQKLFETKRMPASDQEYVLRKLAYLSREHNFKLIFIPEVNINDYANLAHRNLMEEVAGQENIGFVDIKGYLQQFPNLKVYCDHLHFSAFGHGVMADKLFELIKSIYK